MVYASCPQAEDIKRIALERSALSGFRVEGDSSSSTGTGGGSRAGLGGPWGSDVTRREASVVLIDRTLDLAAPASHGGSLLQRVREIPRRGTDCGLHRGRGREGEGAFVGLRRHLEIQADNVEILRVVKYIMSHVHVSPSTSFLLNLSRPRLVPGRQHQIRVTVSQHALPQQRFRSGTPVPAFTRAIGPLHWNLIVTFFDYMRFACSLSRMVTVVA